MKTHKLALVGVGNVGRRLLDLIVERKQILRNKYALEFTMHCVADSSGIVVSDDGIDIAALSEHKLRGGRIAELTQYTQKSSLADALDDTDCDILLEASPLDLDTGYPGLDNSRTALNRGIHLVLANKAPLALAHAELLGIAAKTGAGMLYSATFCGGLPVLNVLRRDMVCGKILSFRGIFNGTTNFMLRELQDGKHYAAALKQAQAIGAAEADPRLDVAGWDTAAKLVIAANQFCEPMISLTDVEVTGIENIEADQLRQCRRDGMALKLIGSAQRNDGDWSFRVEPESVPLDSFLGSCNGWEMGAEIESDIYGKTWFKLMEDEPVPTAASVLRDMVHLATGGRQASL